MFKPFLQDPAKQTSIKYNDLVTQINNLEPEFKKLTDQQLQEKTRELKQSLAENKPLDKIKVQAFALVF